MDIYYKDNVIDEVKSAKFLGMLINNQMNWKNHVGQVLPKSECCMLLDKELNSLFKSGYFAYGLLCILAFSTSIWNNLLGKFNTCVSSI